MNDKSIVNMKLPDHQMLKINNKTYQRLAELGERTGSNVMEADPSLLINFLLDIYEDTIIVRVEDEAFRLLPVTVEADGDDEESIRIASKLKNLNKWEIVEDIKETLQEAIEEMEYD